MVPLYEDSNERQQDVLAVIAEALDDAGIRFAVAGAHAFGLYVRPRATVDVDMLVDGRKLTAIRKRLIQMGFVLRDETDVLRVFRTAACAEPDADLMRSNAHALWDAALKETVRAKLGKREVDVVSRPALASLKFFAAVSPTRKHEDRLQDAADLARLVNANWTAEDEAKARVLACLAYEGAGKDFDSLVGDLKAGRSVRV